jgi:hypothetical protein
MNIKIHILKKHYTCLQKLIKQKYRTSPTPSMCQNCINTHERIRFLVNAHFGFYNLFILWGGDSIKLWSNPGNILPRLYIYSRIRSHE